MERPSHSGEPSGCGVAAAPWHSSDLRQCNMAAAPWHSCGPSKCGMAAAPCTATNPAGRAQPVGTRCRHSQTCRPHSPCSLMSLTLPAPAEHMLSPVVASASSPPAPSPFTSAHFLLQTLTPSAFSPQRLPHKNVRRAVGGECGQGVRQAQKPACPGDMALKGVWWTGPGKRQARTTPFFPGHCLLLGNGDRHLYPGNSVYWQRSNSFALCDIFVINPWEHDMLHSHRCESVLITVHRSANS